MKLDWRVLTLAAVAPMTLAVARPAWAQSSPSAQSPVACAALNGLAIPASAMALPTGGGVVTGASLIPGVATGPAAAPEYCLVSGAIHPVDPKAPDIDFQLALPTAWNHKALMMGGGGYDGSIPALTGNVPTGPVDAPRPIQRGYAVFGSDSGHRAGALKVGDGSFGVNDEAVANFSGEALKKTRDAAVYLIGAHYGQPIAHAYFAGGSSGGREALEVAQKWPNDFDGVIALYPAWNAASLDLQFGRIARALAKPGAYLDPAKRTLLLNAALKACDGLDGAVDGIVSDLARCNRIFDPATARAAEGGPLRCPGGGDDGDTCLSDAQIGALKVWSTPITFAYPLASGETGYPGFNLYGSDLGLPGASPLQPLVTMLALNQTPPASPMPATAPFSSIFWDQWIRYFVARDPGADSLAVDPEHAGRLAARISALTALQDVNKTDMSAFAAHGGKLLMAHGTADVLVSTRASEDYFRRLQATMGAQKVRGFARYYEIAGYGHAFSTRFNAAWDSLTTLEHWVENGVGPPPQIVADTVGVPGRTRPLCEWPGFPRYTGHGAVNDAASFTCATP